MLLRCFALRRNANLAGGFAGRFGCGGFVFVCLWFRDDLPKFLDHTCPCTLLLFIAYAIVRTEPSATSAKPEEKKNSTSSEELNAQISPRTDDEYNLPYHEDQLQEHYHSGASRTEV